MLSVISAAGNSYSVASPQPPAPAQNNIPNQGTPQSTGILQSAAYADSGPGNIFQIASSITNTGSRATVAIFGQGEGNHVWGANFVGYTLSTGDTAIGIEVDAGNIGGAGQASGAAHGLVIVDETGNIAGSPNNTGNAIQISGNGGFARVIRLQPGCCQASGQALFVNATMANIIALGGSASISGAIFDLSGATTGTGIFKTNTNLQATGAGNAALGANCPATTPGAPNTWIKILTSAGTTGYIPVWT